MRVCGGRTRGKSAGGERGEEAQRESVVGEHEGRAQEVSVEGECKGRAWWANAGREREGRVRCVERERGGERGGRAWRESIGENLRRERVVWGGSLGDTAWGESARGERI